MLLREGRTVSHQQEPEPATPRSFLDGEPGDDDETPGRRERLEAAELIGLPELVRERCVPSPVNPSRANDSVLVFRVDQVRGLIVFVRQ